MAFFKFRFPGSTPEAAAEGAGAATGESLEGLRRRARHRLFGSVVLVFIAVVAFPLIFDSQPRPVAVDTPIVIPDRNNTPALSAAVNVPAAQAPAAPLLPAASTQVPPQASLEPGKEEMLTASAPAVAPPASMPSAPAKAAPAASAAGLQGQGAAKSDSDGQKARDLLEGHSPAAVQERLIVQVGAFADPEKVREVRRKLEQAGIATYTQTIDWKDGKRTTRVRVGPFDNRADADKAAARIRKLDLPANVIVL